MTKTPLLILLICLVIFHAPPVFAQSTLNRSARFAENREPAIPRPEHAQSVASKLAALRQKTGKPPNIVWLLIDDMGYDEYYGYYGAQKETSQAVDPARYPDLVLDQDELSRYEEMGEDHSLVHGFKSGKLDEVSDIKSTEDMARADKVLTDFSVRKIAELAKSDKPFFLEHAFMKVHTDNYAHPDFKGLIA